ncbi:MAG TPA: cyclopropane-fatty-acyl-phospholipid synthase family protein, partial [Chitinophagaceae bacterium]|nr:cyclopropane-fatty-acyl-phospholipid synthase family protein [Chitinophagaceae bacterium]
MEQLWYDPLLDQGRIPDWLIRLGLRRLIRRRLELLESGGPDGAANRLQDLVHRMDLAPIAILGGAGEKEDLDVPVEFYRLFLGKSMKYSCCLWEKGCQELDDAERAMLELTCRRAALSPGQHILELGCGWGSLTLMMAERYPGSRITAVSNSPAQKAWIDRKAREKGLDQISVVTRDMNDFKTTEQYDRVITVEMLEHMRNFRTLMDRIRGWMAPGGKLFVQVFSHRAHAYLLEDLGKADWLGRYFFSEGIMPSHGLLFHFSDPLRLEGHWQINGLHYARTVRAWRTQMERNRNQVLDLFRPRYGPSQSRAW